MPPKLAGYEEPAMCRCALRWVRHIYESSGLGGVDSLEELLCIGAEFTRLIGVLTNRPIPEISLAKALAENGSNSPSTLKPVRFSSKRHTISSGTTSSSPNVNTITKNLYYLRSQEGITLKNISATDIANKHTGTIVKVVWQLFIKYVLGTIVDPEGIKRNTPKEIMLGYFKCLEKFVKIRSIRAIQDGLALCALISYYSPNILDFSSVVKENKAQNNRNAFTLLTTNMGLPRLFDFSDLIDVKTSERALMFFVGNCVSLLQNENNESLAPSTVHDKDLIHARIQIRVLEKRIEVLKSTVHRLSSEFELIASSTTTAEETSFHQSMLKELELQNHVIHLEMKVGKLTCALHEQNSQIDELLKRQDAFEEIINHEPPEEGLTDEEMRARFAELVHQNNFLRDCNDSLLKKNNILKDAMSSSLSAPTNRSKRVRSDATKRRQTESSPSSGSATRAQKKKKSSTMRRKPGSSIQGFVSLAIDKSLKRKSMNPIEEESDISPIDLPVHKAPMPTLSSSTDPTPKKKKIMSPRQLVHSESSQELKKDERRAQHKRAASQLIVPTEKNDSGKRLSVEHINHSIPLSHSIDTENDDETNVSAPNLVSPRVSFTTLIDESSEEECNSNLPQKKIVRVPADDTWDVLDDVLSEFE